MDLFMHQWRIEDRFPWQNWASSSCTTPPPFIATGLRMCVEMRTNQENKANSKSMQTSFLFKLRIALLCILYIRPSVCPPVVNPPSPHLPICLSARLSPLSVYLLMLSVCLLSVMELSPAIVGLPSRDHHVMNEFSHQLGRFYTYIKPRICLAAYSTRVGACAIYMRVCHSRGGGDGGGGGGGGDMARHRSRTVAGAPRHRPTSFGELQVRVGKQTTFSSTPVPMETQVWPVSPAHQVKTWTRCFDDPECWSQDEQWDLS